MNAAELLARTARRRPTAPAIVFGEQVSTFGQFHDRVRRLAAGLKGLGLSPGDRVVIVMKNSPALLETLFVCFEGGFVAVPVNARAHPLEVQYIVQDSDARVLVHSEEFNAALADVDLGQALHRISTVPTHGELALDATTATPEPVRAAGAAPEDLAWLFYTSGTTGRPKGVMITHRMLLAMTLSYFVDVCELREEDVVLHAAPLTHGSGLFALPAIARGSTSIIMDSPSFEPAVFFDLIERHRVGVVAFLAPTQIVKLLGSGEGAGRDHSTLRSVCYGGAPMDIHHLRRALEEFGPVFVQIYGQGEAPMTISCLSPAEHADFAEREDPRLASAGMARTGVSLRVVDDAGEDVPTGSVGEVWVKGDVVMRGYWRNETASASALTDGWLHTGDLGRIDDEGYLQLVDRSKDVVITGGNNVYPSEVERVLLAHPLVIEAAVYGVADDYWGESIHAVVVATDDSLTAQDLIAHCGESLSAYKRPRTVDFMAELPKNGYGKIMKRELRSRHHAGASVVDASDKAGAS